MAVEARQIFFLFRDASGQPYIVIEEPAPQAGGPDAYEEEVKACATAVKCEAVYSVVSIREGVKALLIEDPLSTFLMWREGGLQIRIIGPSQTFSKDDAIAAAEAF